MKPEALEHRSPETSKHLSPEAPEKRSFSSSPIWYSGDLESVERETPEA